MGKPTPEGPLAALNAADEATATALVLPLIERSPAVALAVVRRRPFEGPEALLGAVLDTIRTLDADAQMALLRAHPELAPDEPTAMTADSQGEQGRLGLCSADAALRAQLGALNRAYSEKFGFPFIVALHRHDTLASVLASFEARLGADGPAEIEAALEEIASVVEARVRATFNSEVVPSA